MGRDSGIDMHPGMINILSRCMGEMGWGGSGGYNMMAEYVPGGTRAISNCDKEISRVSNITGYYVMCVLLHHGYLFLKSLISTLIMLLMLHLSQINFNTKSSCNMDISLVLLWFTKFGSFKLIYITKNMGCLSTSEVYFTENAIFILMC